METNFNEILQQYKIDAFWDVPIDSIDPLKHKDFVMERLLDYGGMKGIRWMFEFYGTEAIKAVIKKSRRLSRTTAGFWSVYFSIRREEIRCLSEPTLSPLK